MASTGLIIGIVAAVVVLLIIYIYNSLIRLRMRVNNAWSQIDVQLKRRYDLIPNLVSAVKGYMKHEKGVLEKYNVKLIGASPEAIEKAESRKLFNAAMDKIGLEVPRNAVVHSLEEAKEECMRVWRNTTNERPDYTQNKISHGCIACRDAIEALKGRPPEDRKP